MRRQLPRHRTHRHPPRPNPSDVNPFDGVATRAATCRYCDIDFGYTPVAGRGEQALVVERFATHARVGRDLLEREVETTMLDGQPVDALVRRALDGNYDLIVVSPRGTTCSAGE